MPRRKKLPVIPDYTGIAKKMPEKMLVQKSTPLQTLSETDLTLAEFKILDAYLSRINSHKPDERYVRFERGELENLLGVTQLKKDDLSKRIDNLFQVVTIRDPNKPKGFTKVGLFEKAVCEQDENGLWQIDLACSASAMEYIFNIENLRYLKYRLKNVVELTSRYSYILYLYLEQHHVQKSLELSLTELKQVLNCTSESYTAYKEFNDKILKKCFKEINEKTTLSYTYQPIRSGRRVAAIRFMIQTQENDDMQLTFDELSDANRENNNVDAMMEIYGSEQLTQLAESLNYEFTRKQMDEIFSIIRRINIPADRSSNSIHWGRIFYLREKYAALNVEEAKKEKNGMHIKNRYAYFKKMLEQDISTPAAYV